MFHLWYGHLDLYPCSYGLSAFRLDLNSNLARSGFSGGHHTGFADLCHVTVTGFVSHGFFCRGRLYAGLDGHTLSFCYAVSFLFNIFTSDLNGVRRNLLFTCGFYRMYAALSQSQHEDQHQEQNPRFPNSFSLHF